MERLEEATEAGFRRNKPTWLSVIMRLVRALSIPVGIGGGLALTAFKLIALGTENGWRFFWPDLQGNIDQIQSDQWPAVLVVLTEGFVAAAALTIVFSYTVNNISQRISNIWQYMRPVVLPTDVVRADPETRDWLNKLSARESVEQQEKIVQLIADCQSLAGERDALASKAQRLEETLKRAGDRLKANERVFSQFEKLSRAMQSSIDRARQRYPV